VTKPRVLHADLRGARVHKRRKALRAAAEEQGDRIRAVVAGGHHHAARDAAERQPVPGGKPHRGALHRDHFGVTSTTASPCPLSKASSAVMIFVVLAIGQHLALFFSNTAPRRSAGRTVRRHAPKRLRTPPLDAGSADKQPTQNGASRTKYLSKNASPATALYTRQAAGLYDQYCGGSAKYVVLFVFLILFEQARRACRATSGAFATTRSTDDRYGSICKMRTLPFEITKNAIG
jgi:hypothetical protein